MESLEVRYADFENSPSGTLVPTVYGQRAYVPNPLPPTVDLGAVIAQLATAMAAIGELKGACHLLANPFILIRPLQRLEAQTSSAMEGTHTTADALVMAESGIDKEPTLEAVEVNNYTRALSWAVGQLDSLPVSTRLLKGAHARLLADVGRDRGQDKQPGNLHEIRT
ncbi:Fic/DOC family N-terminal domain-containing protein [Seohaeicola zhoushanensis]